MNTPPALGRICLMGSGELAPRMVKVHRNMLSTLSADARVSFIDTPFGFQENADDLTDKAVEFFNVSLVRKLDVASLRNYGDATSLERARFIQAIRSTELIFAGPGSPSYALSNWRSVDLAGLLREALQRGASLTFASAAALTLGSKTIPVYEIYKAGERARWLEGLDIFAEFGLNLVVIPHYNNQEGGNHDTRFCYMGERRLSAMEHELGSDTVIFGIDEHTAAILDPTTSSVSVIGAGGVTLRNHGDSKVYAAGETFPFSDILEVANSTEEATTTVRRSPSKRSLDRDDDFATLIGDDRIEEASVLLLDTVEHLSSPPPAALVPMLLQLIEAAKQHAKDGTSSLGKLSLLVDELISQREMARQDKNWAASDRIRDLLAKCGITIMDTKDGAQWSFEGCTS